MTTTRAWRAMAIALGVLALTSCGRAGDPQPVTAGAPAAPAVGSADGGATSPLPTLPPVQQRAPEQFDAQGCEKGASQASGCATSAAQLDATSGQESPDGTRRLAGFVGRFWSTTPTGSVAVLEPSVTIGATPTGGWQAVGLVRNDQAAPLAGVQVTAELVGADGSVLDTVHGDALVHVVRSGEPVPFRLESTVPAASVRSVRWSAAAADGSSSPADPAVRAIELQTFWTRRPDDPRRVDNDLQHDPASGPLPLLLSGSATNRGGAAIAAPHVVAAWLDGAGRVVAISDVPASDSTGAAAASLDAGAAADFLVKVDAGVAAAVPADSASTPMLWGAGA